MMTSLRARNCAITPTCCSSGTDSFVSDPKYELPVEQGEQFVFLPQKEAPHALVRGDVRRALVRMFREKAQQEWAKSSDHVACSDTWKWAVRMWVDAAVSHRCAAVAVEAGQVQMC